VLPHKRGGRGSSDNLQVELLKHGGCELKAHMLVLFHNITDKNQIPKEWQTRKHVNKKNGQNIKAKITEELLFYLHSANYLQAL
jgi:hypothetical protein